MKITFIGQKGIPVQAGGVERHVEELAIRLARNPELEVVAYTRPWYTAKLLQSYQGVRLVSLPSVRSKNLDAITHTFISLAHASLIEKADIIHIHAVGPALLTWLPRLLRPKARVIVTFHCLDRQHQKWSRFGKLMLWLGEWVSMRFAHEVIAVSNTLKDYAYETYRRVVPYIPNGATIQQALPPSIITQQFGLNGNDYILMVSRLVRHKGAHHLILAYQQLSTDKKLVIVGDSAFTDDYAAELRVLANANPNIVFTGIQTGKALQELFSNAYCMVLPSESEGLPIVLLEAAAYGKALIASNIPANVEVAQDVGELVPVGNVPALRDALIKLLNDQSLTNLMGEAAKRVIQENYLWDDVASHTMRLYQTQLQCYTGQRAQVTATVH